MAVVQCARIAGLTIVRPWSHRTELVAEASSVSRARAFVTGHLHDHEMANLVDDVELVVSELATNALVHAGSPYTVTLGAFAQTVRLEVLDGTHSRPTLGVARAWDTSGRGLAIVQALCREWGISAQVSGGKSVWAEFDIDGASGRHR